MYVEKHLVLLKFHDVEINCETLWLRVAKNTGLTEKLSFKSIPQNSCATNI